MGLVHDAVKAVGKALDEVHAGDDKLASRKVATGARPTIAVRSPEFENLGPLPIAATADGAGIAPTIVWGAVPEGSMSMALLCEDPDAPFPEPYVHWMVYGMPVGAGSVSDGATYLTGKNSKLEAAYTGAAPPPGHGVHHYHFQIFALDCVLELDDGAGRGALLEAMKGHVVAWGEVIGTYERE